MDSRTRVRTRRAEVLGKATGVQYKSNVRSIEHEFDTSRGATMSTATIPRTPVTARVTPNARGAGWRRRPASKGAVVPDRGDGRHYRMAADRPRHRRGPGAGTDDHD